MNEERSRFLVDAGNDGTVIPRSWEVAVGSGDAWSLLRADLQAQLRRSVDECGFRYLRCHGVLCDQMQVVRRDREGRLVYNWRLVDAAYDALLEIGLRPFVEFAFMPSALASGDQAVFFYRANVTPPADYRAWNDLIDALVRHWLERYGADEVRSWFFEVWNEANLRGFWSGTRDDYFRLYEETARTIKAIDSNLIVGGPATSRAEWLPEFLQFCAERAVPLDFVSPHVYPDDDEFEKIDPNYRAEYNRGGYLEKDVRRANAEVVENGRVVSPGQLPIHWTEWNASWRWGRPIHDVTNLAAYLCRAIHHVHREVDSFAYWTISDIFNEFPFPRTSFVGGFGLITIDGLPKPGYHAYQLMHRLGERELPVEQHGGEEADADLGSLDLWAARGAGGVQLLLSNYTQPGLEGRDLPDRTVEVEVSGLRPEARYAIAEFRIDATHANGLASWQEMGSPESPTAAQLAELRAASELREPERRELTADAAGAAVLHVTLPPAGVAFYDLFKL